MIVKHETWDTEYIKNTVKQKTIVFKQTIYILWRQFYSFPTILLSQKLSFPKILISLKL